MNVWEDTTLSDGGFSNEGVDFFVVSNSELEEPRGDTGFPVWLSADARSPDRLTGGEDGVKESRRFWTSILLSGFMNGGFEKGRSLAREVGETTYYPCTRFRQARPALR